MFPEQYMDYAKNDFHHEDRGILKGENVIVTSSVVLPPGLSQPIPVLITPRCIPNFERNSVGKLNDMRISLRSRVAQHGGDMGDEIAEKLSRAIKSEHVDHEGRINASYELMTTITNRSQRPLQLQEGSGVFRFFYCDWRHNALIGEPLRQAVEKGLIKVDGEFGHDWMWKQRKDAEKDQGIIGIYARLEKERFWFPPDHEKGPIIIDDRIKDYRAEIDKVLKPVPKEHKQMLWIGETPKITLDPTIDSVLSRQVIAGLHYQERNSWRGLHINSLLIDGGSNWPIRVEIVSDSAQAKSDVYYVAFQFAQSPYYRMQGWDYSSLPGIP